MKTINEDEVSKLVDSVLHGREFKEWRQKHHKKCRGVEARFGAGKGTLEELFNAYYDFYGDLMGDKRFRASLEKKRFKPIK